MEAEERSELVSRLFALMTAKLEDAAADAVEGQGRGQMEGDQISRAERVEVIARDVGILAESAAAILRTSPAERAD